MCCSQGFTQPCEQISVVCPRSLRGFRPCLAIDAEFFGCPIILMVKRFQQCTEDVRAAQSQQVIPEPVGGAHRDTHQMMQQMKRTIAESLRQLQGQSIDQMLDARFERLMAYGRFKEADTV